MHLIWTGENQGVESLCQKDVTSSGFCQALPYVFWSMQSLPFCSQARKGPSQENYRFYNQSFSESK